jgi:hypothetical protein
MGSRYRQAVGIDAEWRELAAALRSLANDAELADAENAFGVLEKGLALLFEALGRIGHPVPCEDRKMAIRQLLEGAFESSILGLIPGNATVSGIRVGTDRASAQVALAGKVVHQSNLAKTLALGWFAALARSLAHILEEAA